MPPICKALKKAGYKVAANYGGNDEAAKAFKKETKIPVFKWDVGDYVACEQGIVNVENEVGPIEVLVNNAGISRDAMLQKMTHEQWEQVIRTNLDSLFNHDAAGDQRHARAGLRPRRSTSPRSTGRRASSGSPITARPRPA